MNAVGVDLNTASASLLSRVSGLSSSLAYAIIVHRDRKRIFKCQRDILRQCQAITALSNFGDKV